MLHERSRDLSLVQRQPEPSQLQHACGRCDLMLTRMAEITLAFRKAVVALHDALGHTGAWQVCHEEPCLRHRFDVEHAGYGRGR